MYESGVFSLVRAGSDENVAALSERVGNFAGDLPGRRFAGGSLLAERDGAKERAEQEQNQDHAIVGEEALEKGGHAEEDLGDEVQRAKLVQSERSRSNLGNRRIDPRRRRVA